LNFQRLNILAIGLVLVLLPAITLGFVPWWSLLVLFVVYSVILGWGVFDIGSQFFMKTYWKGEPGKIAFTFDDGPHAEQTPRVLKVLEQENVKAAFFCTGKNASANPDLLKRMDEMGHVIGNHTYSHGYVFSQGKAEQQMLNGQKVFEEILGKTPRYYRPPFGVMNPKIATAVKRLNYVIVGWDLRSRDGTQQSKSAIVNRVKKRLGRSSILLFHDTNPVTAEAVREVIHLCRNNGMEIVPLPELIGVEPYQN
jgi:peptidoglycan/xylan/chitin deacetylase (PgdA/CDA1 family)